ncbi:3-oxoacyl-(acyl-carrier-protein) reductase [Thalassoporum mexicanum PCC 7367]|uniref:SDR family oxidoreductase n=1 Tax=Thalassoporum mexicanum TaxID=3457544 RepID=UPI00029FE73F|nr:SDR family oxidoreductase [Pseudanabaena sp. PCC 7367]AFY70829.1 3-oxoacyl-(acyl-carrier-protein) reductase [Pseudanabaena sp. PCC 7367]
MTKTVLITGASSGIGKATAILFQQQGWQVAATMRSPERVAQQDPEFANLERLLMLRLDVTEPESIVQAIATTLDKFGSIDVVVNNAGYALVGAFELTTPDQIQKQFETNVFGLMAVTRAVLPHLRQQRQGTIVNVASVGGRVTFPIYSLYHATKWAIEGFSESLQYELRPFNLKVKIIEPGPIKTDFYDRSADMSLSSEIPEYDQFAAQVMPQMLKAGEEGAAPEQVAKVIYRASTDRSRQLRYPADRNARFLLFLRKLLPERIFTKIVQTILIK